MEKQVGLGIVIVVTGMIKMENVRVIDKILFSICCFSLMLFQSCSSLNPSVLEVKKYCELDYNGARMPFSDRYEDIRKLMAWEEDQVEPGWDCFIIISGYKIISIEIGQNAAIVTVGYSVLAEFCSDYSIEKKNYIDTVDFNLLKIDNAWKIKEYVLFPRISKNVAITYLKNRLKLLKEKESEEIIRIHSLIDSLEKLNRGE